MIYISHKNDLKKNEFKVVTQQDKLWVAVNGKLLSNVCPHQGSLISTCSGNVKNRTCPYHGKTFDNDGNGVNTSLVLETKPLYEWRSLLFTESFTDDCLGELSFNDYELVETRVDKVRASRHAIVELFLDADHINHVHAGVYSKIGVSENDIDNIEWNIYDWGSVQVVRTDIDIKAAWVTLYPGTMIEYQNNSLFITVAGETDVSGSTSVYVFKYKHTRMPDSIFTLNSDVWEEAWSQDKAQAELIVRLAPINNLEPGQVEYRKWQNAINKG
jgi:phenylpropionate dioxygenase-like ring-hydroxylating dioxygenase large terminal subunit